jgi:hypothetical protein
MVMVSDVLAAAVLEIRKYLEDDFYVGEERARIEAIIREMEAVVYFLDPPAAAFDVLGGEPTPDPIALAEWRQQCVDSEKALKTSHPEWFPLTCK